jgi:hypothetical protein
MLPQARPAGNGAITFPDSCELFPRPTHGAAARKNRDFSGETRRRNKALG